MKLLLLMTAFNGLSQAVFDDLLQQGGHTVKLVLAGNDDALRRDVRSFVPDIIICPFLKQRIPEDVWQNNLCIIVHPGIKGDRGPSSIDWAVMQNKKYWGVTALQAAEEMDAGNIWSSHEFIMREATKASLYRDEVTCAAIACVNEVIEQYSDPIYKPEVLDNAKPSIKGTLQPLMVQDSRKIDWQSDTSKTIIKKINAADSFPGVRDELFGVSLSLYNASVAHIDYQAKPKQVLSQVNGAVCISTVDGAIWIGHVKKANTGQEKHFKLPASWVLKEHLGHVDNLLLPAHVSIGSTLFQEIRYTRHGDIGLLSFDFHNGAMGTLQCQRLLTAYHDICQTDVKVIVLTGGREFWSNGIHLNHIEYASNPSLESWHNINAINDIVKAIICNDRQMTVAALGSNAGAGGVMMALACDKVFARQSVVLNPHYQTMGLFGSEYWTYSLPKRVGDAMAKKLTTECLPLGSLSALSIGLLDEVFDVKFDDFDSAVLANLDQFLSINSFEQYLEGKVASRAADELIKPLQKYRDHELAKMRDCFESELYHRSRKQFVYKQCCSKLPQHLDKVFVGANSQVKMTG